MYYKHRDQDSFNTHTRVSLRLKSGQICQIRQSKLCYFKDSIQSTSNEYHKWSGKE